MPRVRTNDVETYYERHGEGGERTVVFVNGAYLDTRQWQPQVDALADEYELVTYDVRGQGRTAGSADERYTIELYAADLKALVDALGLDEPVVCGLSLGGLIAQTYAVRYGRSLGGLVLADTAVSMTLRRRDRLIVALLPVRGLTGPMRLLGMRRGVAIALRILRWTHGEEWLGRDPEVHAYVRQTISSVDAREAAKNVRAVWGFRAVDLESVAVPALVLVGEHESPTITRQTRAFQERLRDCRTAVVPGAGHLANMDNPEAFTGELRCFLECLHTTD